MHSILAIFRKEVRAAFKSPMAYIFLVFFALFNGYFFTNTFFLFNQADMRALFNIVPMVYLFFVPVVTMSLIARENNLGTSEVLATLPIRDYELVVGKYLSALVLVFAGLAFTLVHVLTLIAVGTNIDYGTVICGYIGLALIGALYAALGTFSSSLTDNQVVAFIIAVVLVLVFYLLDKLLIFMPNALAGPIQFMAVDYHLSNIRRGVIDSRNLIYFGSLIWLFLTMTVRVVEMRKWR
ncbi:MAG: ABC transporter permease subunit [bacterium]|jgi:ABC-2 type transport system permease protein|nr:ABC transporter permease subunit [bacterium]